MEGKARGCGPNFTVVTNYRDDGGFACRRRCSYCNWRNSPLLPRGAQQPSLVRRFASECDKSFVTISGGGDPLYEFDRNRANLEGTARAIRSAGKRVRVITREVAHVPDLEGVVDWVSISLDQGVFDEVRAARGRLGRTMREYSMVLPPLPTDRLVEMMPRYEPVRAALDGKLVLRENLCSVFPVDFGALSFGRGPEYVVFVPKRLCLAGRYLLGEDAPGGREGRELMVDSEALYEFLRTREGATVFGGMVKHLIAPEVHMDYGDIDLAVEDPTVLDDLEERFGYRFAPVGREGLYPRYFRGTPTLMGKEIQAAVLDRRPGDAERFVASAQYDVDRVSLAGGEVHATEEQREAVRRKVATRVRGERDLSLFRPGREAVEARHKAKLTRKGFRVIE